MYSRNKQVNYPAHLCDSTSGAAPVVPRSIGVKPTRGGRTDVCFHVITVSGEDKSVQMTTRMAADCLNLPRVHKANVHVVKTLLTRNNAVSREARAQ